MNNKAKLAQKKTKIALIQGGMGHEKEISLISSKAVAKALKKLNYNYFIAPADQNLPQLLTTKKPDIAFLAVHGPYGEDGLIQSLCEYLKIPYTGSGVLASSLCMDKIFLKQILLKNKFPTPDFQVVDFNRKLPNISSYPVVVKSSHGGSSLGISIVKNKKELPKALEQAKKIGARVFIEKYLPDCREIAVSFLDGKVLTPVEIEAKGGFYDYKRKYVKGESSYFLPPRINPFITEKIKFLAEKVFQTIGLRSYGRADFLLQNDKTPWLLEVNSLPGLTETSLLPKSAKYEGTDFSQLIQKIIQMANTDYHPK